MNIAALPDDTFDILGLNFPFSGRKEQDFGPVGEKLGSAAFVGFDMCEVRAQNTMVRLAKGGECERIGRRTVKREEHFAVGFKKFTDKVRGARGVDIVTVAADVP